LRIEVAKIDEKIQNGSFSINNKEITISDSESVFVNTVDISYEIYRINDNDFHLKMHFKGNVGLQCTHCLENYNSNLTTSVSTIFTNENSQEEGTFTLSDSDLDIRFFDEEYLDLEDECLKVIEIDIPISHKCSEHCKGLCSNCGVNLNLERCNCDNSKVDPRWQGLESFINKE
jgi:uncharacterized protein